MLEALHNIGLRLALGTFRTSPVAVEADESSLYSHREKLPLQYAIRLAHAQILLMKFHSHQNILIFIHKKSKSIKVRKMAKIRNGQ